MQLEFKKDFDRVVERLEAWWECEVIDRPCVQATVKRKNTSRQNHNITDGTQDSTNSSNHTQGSADFDNDGVQGSIESTNTGSNNLDKEYNNMREKWMDVEYQQEKAIEEMKQTKYLGDAFPIYFPDLGPDLWATLYETELEFGEDTSWAQHFVEDWNQFRERAGDFQPNFSNQYWQTIESMMELSLEKGKGKYITGLPDLHPGGDLLAALRDPEKLCMDLVTEPETIKEINESLTEHYAEVYNRVYEMVKEYDLGTTTWLTAYEQGKFYVPSCDISALISTDMFEEVFLPGIRKEIEFLDKSIYHLDGPDALRHLDTILDISELDGMQWVYGAGNGPATEWIDVYREIQKAGKCSHVLVEKPWEVEQILDELGPEGLLFTFVEPLSEEEGRKVMEIVEEKH